MTDATPLVSQLLRSRQYGFLPRPSTLTNLLVAEEVITKWLDEGSAVDMIYLDFSKAFDSLNNRLLLDKLRGYDIVPIVISWVKGFLLPMNINGTLPKWLWPLLVSPKALS